MPRRARIVIPGAAHHVTQRGNNREGVFLGPPDHQTYLRFLAEHLANNGVAAVAYCLLPNHVHLVVVPPDEAALARGIGRAHFRYSQYFNRLHRRSGHLWPNRFYSCALDEGHLWAALRYVELNPVRAGLVAKAWQYPWSSAAWHVGDEEEEDSGLLDLSAWRRVCEPEAWREVLSGAVEPESEEALRASTATGWALGDERFVGGAERLLGRRVRPLPVGRPRRIGNGNEPGAAANGDCP